MYFGSIYNHVTHPFELNIFFKRIIVESVISIFHWNDNERNHILALGKVFLIGHVNLKFHEQNI